MYLPSGSGVVADYGFQLRFFMTNPFKMGNIVKCLGIIEVLRGQEVSLNDSAKDGNDPENSDPFHAARGIVQLIMFNVSLILYCSYQSSFIIQINCYID